MSLLTYSKSRGYRLSLKTRENAICLAKASGILLGFYAAMYAFCYMIMFIAFVVDTFK